MIVVTDGNIFETNLQAIVNPVNTIGVMGRGIAKEMKKRYPAMYEHYYMYCKKRMFHTGMVLSFRTYQTKKPNIIINFPTKNCWHDNSKMEYIQTGMVALKEEIRKLKIKSIALPALGCGCGRLDFKEVLNVITDELKSFEGVLFYIYKPLHYNFKKRA